MEFRYCILRLGLYLILPSIMFNSPLLLKAADCVETSNSIQDSVKAVTEILKGISQKESVDVSGYSVIFEENFETIKISRFRIRAAHNGNFIVEFEGVSDKGLIEKYRLLNPHLADYKLTGNDDPKLFWIWDGSVFTNVEDDKNGLFVARFRVDLNSTKKLSNFDSRTVVFSCLDLTKLMLLDSYENYQKEYITTVGEKDGQIVLDLKARKKNAYSLFEQRTFKFNKSKKDISNLLLRDESDTIETVYYFESIQRSSEGVNKAVKQILDKYSQSGNKVPDNKVSSSAKPEREKSKDEKLGECIMIAIAAAVLIPF